MSVVRRVQKLTRRIARMNNGVVNANRTKLASVVRKLRSTKYSKSTKINGNLKSR